MVAMVATLFSKHFIIPQEDIRECCTLSTYSVFGRRFLCSVLSFSDIYVQKENPARAHSQLNVDLRSDKQIVFTS